MKWKLWVAMVCLVCAGVARAEEFSVLMSPLERRLAPELETLIQAAYQSIGHRAIIEQQPHQRALTMASDGRGDALAMRIAALAERDSNLLRVEYPVYRLQVVAFHRKDVPPPSADDLRGARVIVPRGAVVADLLAERYGFEPDLAPRAETVFKMLEAGRADYALFTRAEGKALIDSLELSEVSPTPVDVGEPFLCYHYLNARHAAVVEPLAEALKQLIGPVTE